MRINDTQVGIPFREYVDTKANIEAIASGLVEGCVAFATDTDELGTYTGAAWVWGATPNAHAATHLPSGADPLTTAAAAEIAGVQAAAEGSAESFARSDHAHQIQHAITDNHLVTMDDADAADDDYAKFTADGLEGRSYSEVLGDLSGQAGADFSLNSHKLTAVTDPTGAQDAATKAYVDSVAQGLNPIADCVAMTTDVLPACTYANGTLGVGATLTGDVNGVLPAQDGVTLEVAERLLVKNQADPTENGVYTVTAVGAVDADFVLTRATDMDQADEIAHVFTFISEGTTGADTGWVCTSEPESVVIGTDNITFSQFSAAGQTSAGTGLVKSGNTLSVDGILEDLDTLGAAGQANDFIVSSGAGAFAYKTIAEVLTLIGFTRDYTAHIEGKLSVQTGACANIVIPRACVVDKVYIYVESAGDTSGDTIIDVNKNGTTIFTTQGNRPTVAYDDDPSTAAGEPDTNSLAEYDVLSFDIDSIANNASGLDITVVTH